MCRPRLCAPSILYPTVFCLVFPNFEGSAVVQAEPPKRDLSAIIEQCRGRGYDELSKVAHALGQQRDFEALKAIFNSDLPDGYCAAGEYCKLLDDEKAVWFCTQWELGSLHWEDAFYFLKDHRKEAVIGYIKQVARSSSPEARAACYNLCNAAGWPDLSNEAKKDAESKEPLYGIPWRTLGKIASAYSELVAKKTKPK